MENFQDNKPYSSVHLIILTELALPIFLRLINTELAHVITPKIYPHPIAYNLNHCRTEIAGVVSRRRRAYQQVTL